MLGTHVCLSALSLITNCVFYVLEQRVYIICHKSYVDKNEDRGASALEVVKKLDLCRLGCLGTPLTPRVTTLKVMKNLCIFCSFIPGSVSIIIFALRGPRGGAKNRLKIPTNRQIYHEISDKCQPRGANF